MKKIGFIGMGNMAQALCAGFARSRVEMAAFAPNQKRLSENAARLGFAPCASPGDVCDCADTIVLACKPHQAEGALAEIKGKLSGKVLVSIALGWNFARCRAALGQSTARVQFVMPNTPAMVGEGVFLFEKSHSLTAQERAELWDLFASLGVVEELSDDLMGIGGAVAGCGPAFVDVFIEAYADAAVKHGMARKTAYKLVSQMVLGAAKLQRETGEHPAVLKDNVCSPGGTTIRGVTALEERGLRAACVASIDAIMRA